MCASLYLCIYYNKQIQSFEDYEVINIETLTKTVCPPKGSGGFSV